MDFFLAFFAVYISTISCCFAWEGRNTSSLDILYQSASGDINYSDELVFQDDVAYVGGTNYFLQIDLATSPPGYAKRINFATDGTSQRLCKQFSSDSHCENTVKVLQFISPKTLLLCGTNAKKAKCFHYSTENSTFKEVDLGAKVWLTEFPSADTVSSVLPRITETSDEIYIASSKGDFYRKSAKSLNTDGLNWFKDPEFKAIFHSAGKNFVYLLFNEKSTYFVRESFDSANTKEDYYSMIARVCRNDQGATWKSENFITFNKVRLVCPWPGRNAGNEANVYYDELVSSHHFASSVIGLFRLNRNWNLDSYAIAEFDTDVIDDVIAGKTNSDNRTRYFCESESGGDVTNVMFKKTNVDPFLPGQCPSNGSYTLRSDFEKFALRCTLVKEVVPPVGGRPFFVGESMEKFKFLFAQKFSWTTVVLLLTEKGLLKKIASNADGTVASIFEKQTMKADETILAAKLIESKGYILATTATKVVAIPVAFCGSNTNCGTCQTDPHCEWKAELDEFIFECVTASTFERRTCSVTPRKPKALSAVLGNEELSVSWEQDNRAEDLRSLVVVATRRTQKVAARRATTETSFAVKRSDLRDGCWYDVTVHALNGTSLSEESKSSFSTGLQTPNLTVSEGKGAIRTSWSAVPEASRYIINLAQQADEIIQEVVFSAKSKSREFYFHHFERGKRYAVTVRALSVDDIESSATDEVTPTPIATETSPSFESTFRAETSAVEATTVAEMEPSISTESLTQSQWTTQATRQPLSQGAAGSGLTPAAATVRQDCLGVTLAMGIFIALFVISMIVLMHNVWTIKPRVNELKNDEDGSYYKRQYLLIWSKRNAQTHLKCDDIAMSQTSA